MGSIAMFLSPLFLIGVDRGAGKREWEALFFSRTVIGKFEIINIRYPAGHKRVSLLTIICKMFSSNEQ